MWKIWKEEIYKIASRKIIWCGMILLMAFLMFRLYVGVQGDYETMIDGQTYHGKEAIQKDQELTKKYAGPLTQEKVNAIYDAYGFYYRDPETGDVKGNYCNAFITQKMTNYNWMGGDNAEEIEFQQGADWENNVAPLLRGDVQFDYTYGWDDFRETYGITAVIMLSVILIIGLSPVFTEEYSLKTAGILLTTRRGKKSAIWVKILAAICFAALVHILFSAFMWLLYYSVFGSQGLDASPQLIGVASYGYCPKEIRGFFLFLFGTGLLGILLLSMMVLAVSAICRSSFMAVVVSFAIFVTPVVWIKIFAPMWIFGYAGTRAVTHFMVSMPLYLSMNWGFAFREKQIIMHIVIAAVVGAAGVILSYRTYRNYQG